MLDNETEYHGKSIRLVEKDNRLVEAKYRLTVHEQKLLIMAISKINPMEADFQNPYRLDVREVSKALGIECTGIYEKVAATVDKLMTRLVKLKETDGYTVVHWVSKARYYTGMGYFDISFHEDMRPYLLELKKYLSYEAPNVLQLHSTYSIRIYELLKKWQGVKTNGPISYYSITLVELKDMLGIRKTEYQIYGNFKMRVLVSAQKELAEETEIAFDFTENKQGRAVHSITFLIRDNVPAPIKKIKGKRGRPKKQSSPQDSAIENGVDICTLLDADAHLYPLDLMKKLENLGVKHLAKYKEEGIKETHFFQAMETESEPAKIIYQAIELMKIELKNIELVEKLKAEEAIIQANKAWYDLNSLCYDLDGSTASSYIQSRRGEVLLFSDPEFKEKVDRYRKSEDQIQELEEKTMEMIEREKNPYVEKMKKIKNEERNAI